MNGFIKILSIKNILILIFKPVLMVWTLSLILIILVLLKNIIAPNKVWHVQLMDQWNITIESVKESDTNLYTSSLKADWIMEFSMSGMKDTIADLIVYFFWLFLIYFLVKMVVKTETGIWFIDNAMAGMFDFLQWAISNIPIIPIGGWVGLKALWSPDIENAATRMMWIDVGEQNGRVTKFVWAGEDFSSLSTSSGTTRGVFIGQSLDIIEKNDWTVGILYANKDYQNKLKEWKDNNNDDWGINEDDLKNVRKKIN